MLQKHKQKCHPNEFLKLYKLFWKKEGYGYIAVQLYSYNLSTSCHKWVDTITTSILARTPSDTVMVWIFNS